MKKYDIAAYIWPSYHPDERARIFWPMGIGEWETVMNNEPKFNGHEQPRYPLWGYVNEADSYVMEMQINAAYEHGVNVFIYDWYWYDGMPFLESCLNDGYMKARNNDKVKFYIMWANHDVNLNWDRRSAHLHNQPTLWKGAVCRAEFEKICNRIIDKYFSHPSYYKINGKPIFMLYDLNLFIKGLGGLNEARSALDWLRNESIKKGFCGLELQLTLRRHSERNLTGIVNDGVGTQMEAIEALGFDSLTHYQFCHFADINRDYNIVMNDVINEWNNLSLEYKIPYYPHISVGWDSNPRIKGILRPGIIKNNTPENFGIAIEKAIEYLDNHPNQTPLITVNSWNEWTETSYLQPCTMYGYGYLEALKRVLKIDMHVKL